MSTRQAAEVLAFSRYHARHLARTGAIPATKQNGRWWLDEQAVRELAAGRTRWVSVAAAAALAGISTGGIKAAVGRGQIAQRDTSNRAKPSLDRQSVLAYAERIHAERVAREQEKQEQQQQARQRLEPPPEHGDWVTLKTAAALLGVTQSAVHAMAVSERIPATRCGRRWWLRLPHVEQAMRARAARAAREVV